MPLPPSALVKGKATGRARLGLQPGLVPSFGFAPCSRPRPAWHTRARCFTPPRVLGCSQRRRGRRASEQQRRGDWAPLRPPVSPCMTYAEDPRRADRGSPSSPTAAGGSKGPSTRCPRTPGVPCFFTCSRRRSFMAGSSARSEGTSPSLFTTATLAPWPRKYLWAREPGSVVPLPPSTGSRVRARGSTQSEACLGCRAPPRRCSA